MFVVCCCYHVPHFDSNGAALYFVHVEADGRHQSVTEAAGVDDVHERRLISSTDRGRLSAQ